MATIKQQIEEMKRLKKFFLEKKDKEAKFAYECQVFAEVTQSFIECLEALDDIGVESVERDIPDELAYLPANQRKVVDDYTFNYVENVDKFNKAYAKLLYESDKEKENGIKENESGIDPELMKEAEKTSQYCQNELKGNLKVMDKVITLQITPIDEAKKEIAKQEKEKSLNQEYNNAKKTAFERDEKAKYAIGGLTGVTNGFASCFNNGKENEIISSSEMDDIDAGSGEMGNILEYDENIKVYDISGNYNYVYLPPSEEARTEAENKLNIAKDYMGKTLKESKATKKEKELLKTLYIDRIDNTIKGYPDTYIMYKTPLGGLFSATASVLKTSLADNKLDKQIKKWDDTFPIYTLANKGSKLNDALIEYYEEKKKSDGILSPEKEQEFRLKIYDRVVSTAITYDKTMSAVENPKISDEIKKDGLMGEDPMHIHPLAGRGTTAIAASLDAYKRGLENGWDLEDLPTLAAFKIIADSITRSAVGNEAMSIDKYQTFDPPKWASEETKQLVTNMNNLYEEILSKPLVYQGQRKKYLNEMDKMIKDGIDQKLFKIVNGDKIFEIDNDRTILTYYEQTKKNREFRDIIVEHKKGAAVQPKIDEIRSLEVIESRLNARRTDLWFRSENNEHKALRESFEKLKNYVSQTKKKDGWGPEKWEDYGRKMLNHLDEVEHNSEVYTELRKKASSTGGKERLAGAKECADYARLQKEHILSQMKEKGVVPKDADLNTLRTTLAINQMNRSKQSLQDFGAMPADTKDKTVMNNICSLAADVIVGRIASGENIKGRQMLREYGIQGMKKMVAESKDFKSFIRSCIKDKTMDGKKLAEELSGDGVLRRVQKIKTNIEKENAKLENRNKDKKFESNQQKKITSKPVMTR